MILTPKQRSQLSLLLALSIMGLLFYTSNQAYQQQTLVPVLRKTLHNQPFLELLSSIRFMYAGKEISVEALSYAGFIEFFIRKFAHFITFFALGFSWYDTLSIRLKKQGKAWLVASIVCLVYALFDEWHQGLNPNRSPLVQDVVLDTVGALTGMTMLYLKKKMSQ